MRNPRPRPRPCACGHPPDGHVAGERHCVVCILVYGPYGHCSRYYPAETERAAHGKSASERAAHGKSASRLAPDIGAP